VKEIFLASTSPRRLVLLQQVGINPQVLRIATDESLRVGESCSAYVQRLAEEKAQLGLAQIGLDQQAQGIIIAADTSISFNNHILGKPESFAHACEIWRLLSGQTHQVQTGVAVLTATQKYSCVISTDVEFSEISEAAMQAYWQTGEPHDKAGAYAIQGIAALWVRAIRGSYSNVVGLPVRETLLLLKKIEGMQSAFPLL
jgi:septum formation protein